MNISWGMLKRTMYTVIITILMIWILKEITDRYNVPVLTEIVQKGA